MRFLLPFRSALVIAGLFSLSPQLPQPTPPFEVVSIHRNPSDSLNTQIHLEKGGRLVVVNATLSTLIRNAYGVLPFQMDGKPAGFDNDGFDINATTGTADELTQDTLRPLLQNLLADRFHLKVHWETREVPLYALVTEKGGAKFQPHGDAPGHGMNTRKQAHRIQMQGTDVPMTDLTTNLGNQLGRFVTDATGLPGRYDFVLHWDPNQQEDSTEPSLFTALHEQLGLKLESRKGPMKMLVIDSAEKPSEN